MRGPCACRSKPTKNLVLPATSARPPQPILTTPCRYAWGNIDHEMRAYPSSFKWIGPCACLSRIGCSPTRSDKGRLGGDAVALRLSLEPDEESRLTSDKRKAPTTHPHHSLSLRVGEHRSRNESISFFIQMDWALRLSFTDRLFP